jgi:hypothetical protein
MTLAITPALLVPPPPLPSGALCPVVEVPLEPPTFSPTSDPFEEAECAAVETEVAESTDVTESAEVEESTEAAEVWTAADADEAAHADEEKDVLALAS